VADPGSGGPYECRTLGVVGPGSDGPGPCYSAIVSYVFRINPASTDTMIVLINSVSCESMMFHQFC